MIIEIPTANIDTLRVEITARTDQATGVEVCLGIMDTTQEIGEVDIFLLTVKTDMDTYAVEIHGCQPTELVIREGE